MESSLVSNNHMSVTRKGELSLLLSCKKKKSSSTQTVLRCNLQLIKMIFFKSLYDSLSSLVGRMTQSFTNFIINGSLRFFSGNNK